MAHSGDYSNPLWANLDATITEIETNGRMSLFSISEKKGNQGAGAAGRFFSCCATHLANERGYSYFANSEMVDDHILVVYLEKNDEEISGLIGDKYKKYIFYEPTGTELFNKICGGFLGDLYSRKGRYEEAITYYAMSIEVDPKYAQAYLNRGLAYHYTKQYDLAISDYTRSIELVPEQAMIYNNRGWTYLVKGQYDLAISDFNKAITLNSKDKRFYYNRGLTYGKKGQFDQAISDFTRAIEIDRKHAMAYNDRGFGYFNKGEYDRAISDYTKAIEINPKYAAAYNNRGLAYAKKGQYDLAISDYTKAIEIDPRIARAYYNRGNAYRTKGQYDQAISDYNKALEIDPKYAPAYNNLAWLFATCPDSRYRNAERAIELAKKAVELNSKASHLDTLAAAYAESGRFKDAITTQEKAIDLIKTEGKTKELVRCTDRLNSYKNHKPWRLK